MRIKAVTYARLFNLGDYQNERIELSADIEDWEQYDTALAALKDEVEASGLKNARERGADQDAHHAERGAKARLDDVNRLILVAEKRLEALNKVLKQHGVDTVLPVYGEDIPF